MVALTGSAAQLVLCFVLFYFYYQERSDQGILHDVFEQIISGLHHLNINYHIGVDGISVAMILLTAFVVVAGVLVSWKIEKMSKEFFFLLILLSLVLMDFLFHSICLLFFLSGSSSDPKILTDRYLGKWQKRIQRHETGIDADGWFGLGICGLAWIIFQYRYGNGHTLSIFCRLRKWIFLLETQRLFFPFYLLALEFYCFVSFSYMGARWSLFCTNRCIDVPCRHFHEAGWLWLFAGSHLLNA